MATKFQTLSQKVKIKTHTHIKLGSASTWEAGDRDLYEFEASLVYSVSSRQTGLHSETLL